MTSDVGLIGVGAMGLAVAERLIAAGFVVRGYARRRSAAFVAAGGEALANSAAVAATGVPLILLLSDDAALGDVMRDIAHVLRPDQMILCMGTHLVPAKREAAALAAAGGAVLLDGEISGTPGMVRAGKASVLIAGELAAVSRGMPVLEGFAVAVRHVGTFGNAARVKLVTNYLVGVHTVAAAEALLLARRLGLDAEMVVDAITPSAGGSAMFAVRGRMMAERRFADGDMPSFVRFFELLRAALAESGHGSGPMLDLTEGMFRRAIAEGDGGRDIAAVCDTMDRAHVPTTPISPG